MEIIYENIYNCNIFLKKYIEKDFNNRFIIESINNSKFNYYFYKYNNSNNYIIEEKYIDFFDISTKCLFCKNKNTNIIKVIFKQFIFKFYQNNNIIDNRNISIKNDNFSYVGLINYKNNSFFGKGDFKYKNGIRYVGEWNNENRHGYGTLYDNEKIYSYGYNIHSSHTVKYRGNWVNNKLHGNGTMIIKYFEKYIGSWDNGEKKEGKYIYQNGNIYTGKWKDNMKNEYGIMEYKNGDIYEGDWKDNKKNYGIMKYNNGDIYEGNWKDNKKEGSGKLIYNNGDIYNGNFLNGEYYGYGILYKKNGEKIESLWENGEIIIEQIQKITFVQFVVNKKTFSQINNKTISEKIVDVSVLNDMYQDCNICTEYTKCTKISNFCENKHNFTICFNCIFKIKNKCPMCRSSI